MIVEIISWSISIKVWDWVRIELVIPGSAFGHTTNCTTRPGKIYTITGVQYINTFTVNSL